MARLEDTEKKHNTHMVRTIRVCLYRTRMVRKIVPYAYGMYHTRMVHAIRVRYKIRIWYRTWLHTYLVLQFPNILKWVWLTKALILLQD